MERSECSETAVSEGMTGRPRCCREAKEDSDVCVSEWPVSTLSGFGLAVTLAWTASVV